MFAGHAWYRYSLYSSTQRQSNFFKVKHDGNDTNSWPCQVQERAALISHNHPCKSSSAIKFISTNGPRVSVTLSISSDFQIILQNFKNNLKKLSNLIIVRKCLQTH